jgi:dimeric dUTPase (all-alpha-NTP-PPase superfamily)
MSFNSDKKGKAIVTIKGGKFNGKTIYLSDDPVADTGLHKSFDKLEVTDGIFQVLPNKKSERDVGMIVGASGSGKSYWTKQWVKEYKKQYKDRPIFLFSSLLEDKSLDEIEPQRMKIDDSLLTDPIEADELENALVIFDDIDALTNKKQKEAVYTILNKILTIGRHFNTSVLITSHLANGNLLKTILNELHFFVYFPQGTTRSTLYVLENYIGVSKNLFPIIKATRSRWACVLKNYPAAIITEHKMMLSE